MSEQRRRMRQLVFAWAPAAVYMGLMWAISSMTNVDIPLHRVPWRDKGAHFVEYALLGCLLAHAFQRSQPKWRDGIHWALAMVTTLAWGVVDEIHQAFVPGRNADVADLGADALGALFGVSLWWLIRRMHGKARVWSACLCCLWLAALPRAWADSAASGGSFTESERRALRSGELVVRPQVTQRDGARLMGGSSWQVIDVPVDVLWQAVLDTNRYDHMLPSVAEARVDYDGGKQRKVFLRQGKWPIFASYHLLVDVDEAKRHIQFRVDPGRPGSLNSGWGFMHVQAYGRDRSLLAFAIMADAGSGIVASLARGTMHEWMLKVPWTIKRFLESGGKNYYGSLSALRRMRSLGART